jgi:hypothetical protein
MHEGFHCLVALKALEKFIGSSHQLEIIFSTG